MPKCVERFNKYRRISLDSVLMDIKHGIIKSGKYSHLVKIDGNKNMKGKVFFDDGPSDDSDE